jgi:hypothetical protein
LALMKFMRLSSMKAAHAAVASSRVQEIRVKPSLGLSGITALNVPLFKADSSHRVVEAPRLRC